MQVTQSSKLSFWPILGICNQLETKQPFIVALYEGEKKPSSVDDFLKEIRK